MSKNPFELHEERLGTVDEDGNRIMLYMDNVKGKWEKYRFLFYYFLLGIYLITPWTKMNGRQTLFINIPAREFNIFGSQFFAHDIPLLFILLLSFIITISIVTALWGRVWCGWACPQTVFIETIYRQIERLVEGKAHARKKLANAPWSVDKVIRKILKWSCFAGVSVAISHSFLAYFVGSERLLHIVLQSPSENWTIFLFSCFFAGLVLFDFGWFREQFCLIACPYGRFQSVFMDKDSLVVAYDYNRGEPRKSKEHIKDHSDCINCYKCVQVCPTGIDIRRGTQLECIHCTRCIDACDDIMRRVKKPTGLIRYTTESELEGGKTKRLKPRTMIYAIVMTLLVTVGSYVIYNSKNVQVLFLRATQQPYQISVTDGVNYIVNNYKVEFFYRDAKEIDLDLKVEGEDRKTIKVISPIKHLKLKAGRKTTVYVFLKVKASDFTEGSKDIEVGIYDGDELLTTKELTLVGPVK